jgi:L-threonylcarbamoyladenylate synthase
MKDDSGHAPILKVDALHPQASLLAAAVTALQAGRTLIFPTDTVYGIGLLVSKAATPDPLYTAKQRDGNKAIPLLLGSTADLERYATELPLYAKKLAQTYWPGSLTLVVRASQEIPPQFCAHDGTVALRVPNSKIAQTLIRKAGQPLATTSANLQGRPPPTSVEQLDPVLAARAALIIDGGVTPLAQPSTIVSCLGVRPVVLRKGSIIIDDGSLLKKEQV